MKQSSLYFCYFYDPDGNRIFNYHSSPFTNHVSPIIMNKINQPDRVMGINCFNEFLSYGDFLSYIQKAFPNNKYSNLNNLDLVFYSKRLNLFVNKGCIVHYLH